MITYCRGLSVNLHAAFDEDWDNGAHCYKMITITVNGKSTQAQIVDEVRIHFSRHIFSFHV